MLHGQETAQHFGDTDPLHFQGQRVSQERNYQQTEISLYPTENTLHLHYYEQLLNIVYDAQSATCRASRLSHPFPFPFTSLIPPLRLIF
jgi:hypothetical protein